MIILQCIKEEKKLRIKFYCHFDIEGSGNIDYIKYDKYLNCKFPKNKRKEGRFYGVDDSEIKLNQDFEQPFYKIYTNEKNIKVFQNKYELEDFLGLNKETVIEPVQESEVQGTVVQGTVLEEHEKSNLPPNPVIEVHEEVKIDDPVIEPKKSIFEKLFSFFW